MSKQQRLVKAISKGSSRNVMSIMLLLILISGGVIYARAWSAPGGGAGMSFLSGATQSNSEVETVSVVLGRHGFTPASVTRPAGPFRLEVANQSGTQEITLQIKRDGGGLVQEWNIQSGAQSWSEVVDLPQGGYILTVASDPAWLFHITVQ